MGITYINIVIFTKIEKEYLPVPCPKHTTVDTQVSPVLIIFIASSTLVDYSDGVVDNDPYKVVYDKFNVFLFKLTISGISLIKR